MEGFIEGFQLAGYLEASPEGFQGAVLAFPRGIPHGSPRRIPKAPNPRGILKPFLETSQEACVNRFLEAFLEASLEAFVKDIPEAVLDIFLINCQKHS